MVPFLFRLILKNILSKSILSKCPNQSTSIRFERRIVYPTLWNLLIKQHESGDNERVRHAHNCRGLNSSLVVFHFDYNLFISSFFQTYCLKPQIRYTRRNTKTKKISRIFSVFTSSSIVSITSFGSLCRLNVKARI